MFFCIWFDEKFQNEMGIYDTEDKVMMSTFWALVVMLVVIIPVFGIADFLDII